MSVEEHCTCSTGLDCPVHGRVRDMDLMEDLGLSPFLDISDSRMGAMRMMSATMRGMNLDVEKMILHGQVMVLQRVATGGFYGRLLVEKEIEAQKGWVIRGHAATHHNVERAPKRPPGCEAWLMRMSARLAGHAS